MQKLNLPQFNFKIKTENGKSLIFDDFRKKYIVLTPEEWVRQNFLKYLVENKNYPASLIIVESGLKYNKRNKRLDIISYNKKGEPHLIVECKAPEVKITQNAFNQVAVYNMAYKVKYLIVTNGLNHFCCKMNYKTNSYEYLKDVPVFE